MKMVLCGRCDGRVPRWGCAGRRGRSRESPTSIPSGRPSTPRRVGSQMTTSLPSLPTANVCGSAPRTVWPCTEREVAFVARKGWPAVAGGECDRRQREDGRRVGRPLRRRARPILGRPLRPLQPVQQRAGQRRGLWGSGTRRHRVGGDDRRAERPRTRSPASGKSTPRRTPPWKRSGATTWIAGDGKVYAAVWGGGILEWDVKTRRWNAHRDPDREMEIDLYRDDGLIHIITTSASYVDEVLWASTYFGLSRYDGRHWRGWMDHDSGLASNFINFTKGRSGTVLLQRHRSRARGAQRLRHRHLGELSPRQRGRRDLDRPHQRRQRGARGRWPPISRCPTTS